MGRIEVRGRILALLGELLVEERLGLDAADLMRVDHAAGPAADQGEHAFDRERALAVRTFADRTDPFHQRLDRINGASLGFQWHGP